MSDRHTFFDGQLFRLSVRPARSGYLYILCLNSRGSLRMLHPAASIDNYVGRGRVVSLPERGWFRFDAHAGIERIYVLLSERPVQDLDYALTDGAGRAFATLHRLTTPPAEPRGVDVVAPPAPLVVKRIQLRHRPWDVE